MSPHISKIIRRIQASMIQQADVRTAMQNQADRIRVRTRAGMDVDGKPFARKKDGTPSRLYHTGNLLRSLQADVLDGERGPLGRIRVTGRARDYAPFVNMRRRFLGASQDDRRRVVGDMKEAIRQRRSD